MKTLKLTLTALMLMFATATFAQEQHLAKQVTAANYETTVSTDKLVVIDFWASWCGSCRMIAPVVEELAKEYNGTVIVGKVNVDEEEELASKFSISSIPTLLFIKNKKVVHKEVGAKDKETLKKLFEQFK